MIDEEFESLEQIKEYVYNKPNKFLTEFMSKPVFSGLPFSEHDFQLLSEVLHGVCLEFAEEGSETYDDADMERIGSIMDECDKIVAKSNYVKEKSKRLRLCKELRSMGEG